MKTVEGRFAWIPRPLEHEKDEAWQSHSSLQVQNLLESPGRGKHNLVSHAELLLMFKCSCVMIVTSVVEPSSSGLFFFFRLLDFPPAGSVLSLSSFDSCKKTFFFFYI